MYDQVCLVKKESCLGYKDGFCISIENCMHKEEINIAYQELIHRDKTRYINGAADFMNFMQNYYNGEPIYPSEMEDIYKKFLERYEKEVRK
jgi:hypothetical protein